MTSFENPEGDAEASPFPEGAASDRRLRTRLYLASFLMDAASYGFALVVSAHARSRFGATSAELGYLGTLSTGFYAFGCLWTGGLSDRIGSGALMRSSAILLALVVCPLSWCAGIQGGILSLCATNALWGLILSVFWPPLMRQLSLASPGDTLWRSVGSFNVFWALGSSLGSYAGPASYDATGFAASLGAISAVLLGTAASLRGEPSSLGVPAEPRTPSAAGGNAGVLFLRLAWVANFAVCFAMGGIHSIFIYVGSTRDLSLATIGFLLLAKEFGRFVAFSILGRTRGWHYSSPWLFGLQAAAALALILSGFTDSTPMTALLFLVVGGSSGLAYYSSLYYGLNLRSGEGKKSGLHETILAMGYCLGPLLCGKVGEWFPSFPGGVLVLAGIVVAGGLAVQVGLLARARRTDLSRVPSIE